MQINEDTNVVSVHGREALDLPYTRWTRDTVSEQVDISDAVIFIEIPAAGIRKRLIANPADTRGLRIYLTRAEVALIPTTATPYILIDETDEQFPTLELEGRIYRTGYTQEPFPAPSVP